MNTLEFEGNEEDVTLEKHTGTVYNSKGEILDGENHINNTLGKGNKEKLQ